MRQSSLTLAVLGFAALGASSALATDYYSPPGAAYWNGAYLGVQGGWARDVATYSAPGEAVPFGSLTMDGWLWGGRIGLDRQSGNLVIGALMDISIADVTATVLDFGGGGSDVTGTVDRAGSFRGRIGMAFNKVLLYGTGGLAVAHVNATVSNLAPGDILSDSASNTHVGWTAGLGAEIALKDKVSLGFEWLYADYGSKTYHFDDGVGTLDAVTHLTGNTYLASLNFRFR